VHRLRGEVAGAVEREQVVPVEVVEPLQPLAALQLRKQRLVQRLQTARVERIEALAKARVARRPLDPVERLEVRPRGRLLAVVLLELQQRGILQPEQRQPRHQVIDQVEQQIKVVRVTLKAPSRPDRTLPDVTVTALLATEAHLPAGEDPLDWLLLTNLSVETTEQAIEKLQVSVCRWQIEISFKVLKSSCRIEALQLEKRERLEPALAFDMIIARRVLHLSMLGRACPEMPCNRVFSDEAWQALYLATQRQPPPDEPPSLDTMVSMVATLGGQGKRI
jgi:hypothetical protein